MTRTRVNLAAMSLLVGLVFACSSAESDGTGYPILPSNALTDIGEPIYEDNCAGCHGAGSVPPPLPFVPSGSVKTQSTA